MLNSSNTNAKYSEAITSSTLSAESENDVFNNNALSTILANHDDAKNTSINVHTNGVSFPLKVKAETSFLCALFSAFLIYVYAYAYYTYALVFFVPCN